MGGLIDSQVGVTVPGLTVVVVNADREQLAESWGYADVATHLAMEPSTMCNWFSMTKLVTATAAMQLHDRGLLDLDKPVEQYFEPFARVRQRSRPVTTRHLLSHSSGLANPIPLRWVHLPDDEPPDRSRFVARLIAKHPKLRFDPGTQARYSNLGYLVIGEVIQAASSQDFEGFIRDNVLLPLGMEHTSFLADPGLVWATPYQRRGIQNLALRLLLPRKLIGRNQGRFLALENFYVDGSAYGGLVGPAAEAARFLQAHLRDGELNGFRLLSSEATESMRTITAWGNGIEVGLGWYRRGRNPHGDYVEHLGGGAGFWNCMRQYPKRRIGVVMMGNATIYDHQAMIETALNPDLAD